MLLRKKTVKTNEEIVEVDGHSSALVVKLDFNNKTGTFKVTGSIVSKQWSITNNKVNAGIIQRKSEMEMEACNEGRKMRLEWKAAQPQDDTAQMEIPTTDGD